MGRKAERLFKQGRALFAGRDRDPERAVALLVEAADLGHGEACWMLGRRLGRDDPEGLRWLRRGIELGDDKCRVETAMRLLGGIGTPVDEGVAADLLRAAAGNGNRVAAEELTGLRRRQASRRRTPEASLEAAVAEYGLHVYADVIRAAVLPSVRLVGTPSSADGLPVGASKLGGTPDLGEAVEWPNGTGRPLSFIAQINLATVAPCLPGGLLPAAGLLSFFYDAEGQPWGLEPGDRAGWQVVFAADAGSLRRAAAPGEVTAFGAVALTPQPEQTLPFGRTMEARGFGFNDDASDRYGDMREAFGAHPTASWRCFTAPDVRASRRDPGRYAPADRGHAAGRGGPRRG